MNKNKFKFEVTFNLNTVDDEKLDKHSIKQFERALFDFVNNYAGVEGTFYTYSNDSDGEAFPTNIKVKQTVKK
jgi:hypothetical protein